MQLEVVKDYYGKLLKSSKDLKISACCDGAELPPHLQPMLANVHPEVAAKYYGCGIVVPAELRGRRVLDLGSGSGRDTSILAQLVGPEGEVVGVDMTDEQLATANAISIGTGNASVTGRAMCASSKAISRSSMSSILLRKAST